MKAKGLISLSLAVTMLMMAGCGSSGTKTNTADSAKGGDAVKEAEGWAPDGPVTLVVGFSAGGNPDKVGRAFASVASKYTGSEFVIDNRSGSGGAIAMAYVKSQEADGQTIMICSEPSDVLVPDDNEYGVHPYEDFTVCGRLYVNRGILAVPADAPYKTFEELLAYDKENPSTVTIATSGVGSAADKSITLVNQQLGSTFVGVPFDSSNDSLMGVLGGHVDAFCGSATTAYQQIESGALIPLVSTYAANEDPRYPGTKILQDYEVQDICNTYGISIGAECSPPMIDYYVDLVSKVTADQEFIDQMATMNMSSDYQNPEEYTEYLLESWELQKSLLSSAGAQ